MNRRQRAESRLGLAMLPVGGTMTIVSVGGGVAVLILAFDTIVQRPAAAGWLLAWCVLALVVAAINLRQSIEAMSAFDWRPLVPVAMLSAMIVALYPGWWF